MLLQLSNKQLCESFLPKDIIIHKRQNDRHICQKEDDPQNYVPQEATVLGTIQILFGLMIASLGAILVSASHSSHFKPAGSATLMSGYPFVGALCFVIAGSLSIISGKIATKSFAVSSLISSAASFVAAGFGLFLLSHSLVALNIASPHGTSGKKNLSSSSPSSEYYYLTDKEKNCLLADVGITGGLAVTLVITVLEILLAAYASAFWWRQVYPNKPESVFSLPQSRDHTEHVKIAP